MSSKNKTTYLILVAALIALLLVLSGCTLPGIFKDSSDETVFSGTAEAEEMNIVPEIQGRLKEVRVQEGQKVSSGDIVAVIDSSESSIKLQQSGISLKSVQNNLDNLKSKSASNAAKKAAQYEVDLAERNMELARIANDKTNITSVSAGIVQLVNFKPGEFVSPGTPIATLLDMQDMYVKIYVPEKVLPYISVDKEVTMKSDYLKDKTIKGKIAYISSEAEFTPMNIVTKKDREKLVYAVKVKILDNMESIKPGMLLDVDIAEGAVSSGAGAKSKVD